MSEWILWGYNARIGFPFNIPLALTGGNLRHCRAERTSYPEGNGWQLGIYRKGDAPVGLRLQAETA
jgi:hypothetical protein